jgi:Ethanolamine utilization protein EutJ (predicted chaperonin)
MANALRTSYVAECFWAGVQEEDLRELDRRIEASVVAVAGDGEPVRCLGWLLVIDDEVVLVLFEGSMGTVRRVAEHAEIPFGRILRAAHAPWPPNPPTGEEIPE